MAELCNLVTQLDKQITHGNMKVNRDRTRKYLAGFHWTYPLVIITGTTILVRYHLFKSHNLFGVPMTVNERQILRPRGWHFADNIIIFIIFNENSIYSSKEPHMFLLCLVRFYIPAMVQLMAKILMIFFCVKYMLMLMDAELGKLLCGLGPNVRYGD